MELTREQTIEALECCVTANSCDKCPMKGFDEVNECCCDLVKKCAINYLKESNPPPEFEQENEPAPAATETSSEVSSDNTRELTHLDDNTLLDICQEALLNIAVKITVINNSDEYIQGYATAVVDVLDRLRGGI